MNKPIILAALIACALPAHADPDRVSVLLGSKHVGATGFNEQNPGIFLTWEDGPIDWTVGAYRNSYKRLSVAATGAVPLVTWDRGELSAFAGVAHYPGNGRHFKVHAGDFVPIGGLQVRHGHGFVQVMPMDGQPVEAVVSFGLTWELN